MNIGTLIMSSIAVVLFIFSYEFSAHREEESLYLVLKSIYDSNAVIYWVFVSCITLTVLNLLRDKLEDFLLGQKFYADRISVQEYESQKTTYTQLKLNELLNSQAYKEYTEKKLNNH